MDFFKILNGAFSVVAWLIVLGIIWALAPYAGKLMHFIQTVHDFGK